MFNEDAVLVLTVGAVEPMGRCVWVVTPTIGLGGLLSDRSLRGFGGRFGGGRGFQELPTAVPSQWFGELVVVGVTLLHHHLQFGVTSLLGLGSHLPRWGQTPEVVWNTAGHFVFFFSFRKSLMGGLELLQQFEDLLVFLVEYGVLVLTIPPHEPGNHEGEPDLDVLQRESHVLHLS